MLGDAITHGESKGDIMGCMERGLNHFMGKKSQFCVTVAKDLLETAGFMTLGLVCLESANATETVGSHVSEIIFGAIAGGVGGALSNACREYDPKTLWQQLTSFGTQAACTTLAALATVGIEIYYTDSEKPYTVAYEDFLKCYYAGWAVRKIPEGINNGLHYLGKRSQTSNFSWSRSSC